MNNEDQKLWINWTNWTWTNGQTKSKRLEFSEPLLYQRKQIPFTITCILTSSLEVVNTISQVCHHKFLGLYLSRLQIHSTFQSLFYLLLFMSVVTMHMSAEQNDIFWINQRVKCEIGIFCHDNVLVQWICVLKSNPFTFCFLAAKTQLYKS